MQAYSSRVIFTLQQTTGTYAERFFGHGIVDENWVSDFP